MQRIAIATRTEDPRPESSRITSVQLEGVFVIAFQGRVLAFLPEKAITNGQDLDIGAHEAAKRIFWRANDGFSPNIEACVNQ